MVLNDLFLLCNRLSMEEICKKIESVEYKLQQNVALLDNPCNILLHPHATFCCTHATFCCI